MEILSYPIGLLVGLFPIAASLGPAKAPAHLLLDGQPVCELTERSPGCMVDLGRDPRVHLLELLRTDAAGHVTERVRRWVNRPGIESEVLVAGGCDEAARQCEFDITWAHPLRLDPKTIDLALDGALVWHGKGKERHASVSLGARVRPQVLVADAEFPDGARATYSRTLHAAYPEEAQAALQAVPLLPSPDAGSDESVAAALRSSGWPVRTVEAGEIDVTFVMQPTAFDGVAGFLSKTPDVPGTHQKKIGAITGSDIRVDVIAPNQLLSTYRVAGAELGRRVPVAVPSVSWSRYGDAVAAAGYELGRSPRRRAVVLVLNRFDRLNASTFDARQARAYLSEVLVPLVVWRIGPAEVGPEWPEGKVIASLDQLRDAFDVLMRDVEQQRIAWLEGTRDLRYARPRVAAAISLAGRTATGESPSSAVLGQTGEPAVAVGPEGGDVHVLASAREGAVVLAGTHAGVFRSTDGARRWEPARRGLPPGPVRSLAVSEDVASAFAATDAGLFRSEDVGDFWQAVTGPGAPSHPTRVALEGGRSGRVYVGTRGEGVLRSDDGGETFLRTLLDGGDVRALAVDRERRVVWAATEQGLFRSADQAASWNSVSGIPSAVTALDVDSHGRIFAATAGDGLFASNDGGASWGPTKLGAAYLTDVAAASGARVVLAASPDGVFSSSDGGNTWKLARIGPVAALCPAGSGRWAAGGARGILRAEPASKNWIPSNSGLTATSVFALAILYGSPGSVLAGTARGIFRSDTGDAWKRLPGAPEAVEFYAITRASESASDLLVGSSGEIGRSFGLDGSWSWLPAPAVFGLTSDPAHPGSAFAATRGSTLHTQDGGITWEASSEGLTRTFPLQLALDPLKAATVYAATAGSGVFRSADRGRTWKPYGPELSRAIVRCLVADGSTADRLFAGTDRGVFASVPAVKTWAPLLEGLPRAPVYALLAAPESPATLFAGTGEGVFFTRDFGQSWMPVPAGDVAAPVTALVIDRSRRRLYAGTLGAGVFAVPLPD